MGGDGGGSNGDARKRCATDIRILFLYILPKGWRCSGPCRNRAFVFGGNSVSLPALSNCLAGLCRFSPSVPFVRSVLLLLRVNAQEYE